MKTRLWHDADIAKKELQNTRNNIDFLMDTFFKSTKNNIVVNGISFWGPTLVNSVYKLCELALFLVYWDYSTPEGRLGFPTLKDLNSYTKDVALPISARGRVAAKSLNDIKKDCDITLDIDWGMMEILLVTALDFVKEMADIAKENRGCIEEIISSLEGIKDELSHIMKKCYKENADQRMNFIVLPKDEDEYSDDKLDEIYRIRKTNQSKYLAPVYILEIMMNYSDRDNKLGVNDVKKYLEDSDYGYGIVMERKAVGRALRQLRQADYLCQEEDKNGYWYDPDVANRRLSQILE